MQQAEAPRHRGRRMRHGVRRMNCSASISDGAPSGAIIT